MRAAERNEDQLAIADLYRTKGELERTSRSLALAQESYNLAITRYESLIAELKSPETRREQAQIQQKIGRTWGRCSDLKKAIDSYLQAFSLYASEGDILEAAHIKVVVGDLQQSAIGEEAVESYREALELYRSKKDIAGINKVEARLEQDLK